MGEAFDIFDGADAEEDVAILDHVGGSGVVVDVFVEVFGAIGMEASCASFDAEDIESVEFADIGLCEGFSVKASGGGDLGEGVAVAGELDQVEDGGSCDALGHACSEIAFGVNDFVSADETEDLGVEIAGCAGDDVRDFEACDQGGGEDGTFDGLGTDGDDDGIEVLDGKGAKVVFVGGVGADGAGDGEFDAFDDLGIAVDGDHFGPPIMECLGDVKAKTSETDHSKAAQDGLLLKEGDRCGESTSIERVVENAGCFEIECVAFYPT